MIRSYARLGWGLLVFLAVHVGPIGPETAKAGNELRPGEEIWDRDGYAWRSLCVPRLSEPGEYYDCVVVATDPDGNKLIGSWDMMTFDGVDFQFDENIPGGFYGGGEYQEVVVGKDRISGEGYAAWAAGVRMHEHDYCVAARYQDGEYAWWYPHTPQYPGWDGFAGDVGIDSSGLVWIAGFISVPGLGTHYGAFCVDGDPNLDESWRFVEFLRDWGSCIDCGRGKLDRCILGCDGSGIGWVDEGTTSGTVIDLTALGGSYDIQDVAVRVCDETAWVASEDGVFGYACNGPDCWMIDSYTPADEGWESYFDVCSDERENVWAASHNGLVLQRAEAWRRFPLPADFGYWPREGLLVSDNDGVPWVFADKELALYWQDCELQVRTDRAQYRAGDVAEMVWSMKNLGPTIAGSLYVGIITPSGEVLCWDFAGWHAGLIPVLRDATYIPGLMFKPITFAAAPITEATPPGDYRLATAVLSTSGTIMAYNECPFTIGRESGGKTDSEVP